MHMHPRIIAPTAAPLPTPATILLDGAATGDRFAIVDLRLARGQEPPLRRHHREDLLILVQEGEVTVHLDGEVTRVAAGSWVVVPRGVEHGLALASASAHLVVILAPAGAESCLAGLHHAGTATAAAQIEAMITTAARHDVDITGPPPASA